MEILELKSINKLKTREEMEKPSKNTRNPPFRSSRIWSLSWVLSTRQRIDTFYTMRKGFPGGSMVKNLPANTGDPDSIPELGRSPGEGNGNPLQ